jgi:hypothetical protein
MTEIAIRTVLRKVKSRHRMIITLQAFTVVSQGDGGDYNFTCTFQSIQQDLVSSGARTKAVQRSPAPNRNPHPQRDRSIYSSQPQLHRTAQPAHTHVHFLPMLLKTLFAIRAFFGFDLVYWTCCQCPAGRHTNRQRRLLTEKKCTWCLHTQCETCVTFDIKNRSSNEVSDLGTAGSAPYVV